MPNIGPGELILVLVIVLIIFGPGKLPDIGNAIGRGVREFRKASTDLEDTIRGESKPAPTASDASAGEASPATPATPASSGSSTPEAK
jgi:sec-independent protein translocase protein TatA